MMATVRDVLGDKGHSVWTISPDAKVIAALELMAEKNVGALVVTDKDELVGIISERDYARKVMLKDRTSLETPVRDIMTRGVYYVSPDTSTQECMAMMSKNRIRHLPVIHNEKLIGIVSIGDVVRSVVSEQKIAINHLENYIIGKYL